MIHVLKTTLLAVLALILISGWWWTRLATITLSELAWEEPPSFVAINTIERDGRSGLLFIRLADGQEQFLPGSWQVMVNASNAYAWGEVPAEGDQPATWRLFHFSGDGLIYPIALDHVDGHITRLEENPAGTYLMLEVTRDNATAFCLIERSHSEAPACQQLNVSNISTARWNPAKERELVINTTSHELFTFNPWEKQPQFVDPAVDATTHQTLARLFTDADPRPVPGWLKWRFPARSFTWAVDYNHVIRQQAGRLSVIELSTGHQATVLTDPKLGHATITATPARQ